MLLPLLRSLQISKPMRDWQRRAYDVPSPHEVKQAVLRRHHIEGATWGETGTASGRTTTFLARFAPRVITIEPQAGFHAAAKKRFANVVNVEPVLGTSDAVFPGIIEGVSCDLCLWLDGHYSGGETFAADIDTPIRAELAVL